MIYKIKRNALTMLIAVALFTVLLSACGLANETQTYIEEQVSKEAEVSSPEPSEASSATLIENPSTEEVHPLPEPDDTEEDWQVLFDRAAAMEIYLRDKLSSHDHGGMYVLTGSLGDTLEETSKDKDAGKPKLFIWALNKNAVDSAIESYPDEKANIVLEDARWSFADMENFANELKAISLNEGEKLLVYTSDESNSVTANITDFGADRLKAEINALIQKHNVPKDCVTIWIMGTESNPVT